MSISINKNTKDTPTGVASPTIEVVGLNYKSDFCLSQKSEPGRTVLDNTTSPRDAQERMILASSTVKDIYSNTDIPSAFRAGSRQGVSVLVQLNSIWSLTNSEDATYRVDLPISAHLVLKVPSSYVSTDDVKGMISRMLGGLYETGSTDTSRLDALLRGNTVPKGIN